MDRLNNISPEIHRDIAKSASTHAGRWTKELARVIAEADLALGAGLLDAELSEALIDTESRARVATNALTQALQAAYTRQKRG